MAQQTIGIGAAPNDGTGDPIRDAFDKCNDNFTELYGSLAGLLDFGGATDCSTNPNYPAASQGDIYIVSVAGKIGGASGKVVEVGDFYLALADNAGGDEATVGTSWAVLQANITGGIGSGVDVEDEGVAAATGATILNFVGAGVTAADVGGGQVDITIPGSSGGIDVEDEGVAEATAATVLNFTGTGVTATDVGGGQVDIDIPGSGASAAPAIRSSNLVKYASGASYSHPLPTGAAAGDFCVVFHSGGFPIATLTSPAKATWDTYQHTASNWGGTVFTRVLTASDITDGSVTITPSGSFDAVCGAVCFTGEAKLRFPFSEQGTRAAAIHSPGSGATSSTQETPYASADDCILTFLSNRASSTNTSDHGTQLQTTTNANGSGALYAHESPSAGGQLANLAYSTAGTGRYEVMLVVRGPN